MEVENKSLLNVQEINVPNNFSSSYPIIINDNSDAAITLGENSKVIILEINQNANSDLKRKFTVKRNASLFFISCNFGEGNSLLSTNLEGEGASSKVMVIFFGDNNQKLELKGESIHNAPNTNSDLMVKGVLNGSSKANFEGLVRVEENAFNSSGYQKEDTLLLSSDAESNLIPNLEIKNNNVKCSHGATVGRINQEQLFYLSSRGISEKMAKVMLIEGFFEPIIKEISSEDIKKQIGEIILEKMKNVN